MSTMNSSVKCSDIVFEVIKAATIQFAPIWHADREKCKILKQYCDVIDLLSKDFGGKSFEAEVDQTTMSIMITLECRDVTIETKVHNFYNLLARANSFCFSESKNGLLNLRFEFPSVWER